MTPPRVLLVGAHGHGTGHLARLRRLADAGRLELAGVCDVRPPDAELAGLARDAPWCADLEEALRTARPDVGVVVTPIPTHAPIGEALLRAGADVLLEKPPTATWAEFERLRTTAGELGRRVQVGFQSLGSAALPAVRADVAAGRIGRLVGIGGRGTWQRTSAYFTRARWAGRRTLDGQPVVDGALTNAFAHAVATALRLEGGESPDPIAGVELELLRANPVEADDTSCVRITTAAGTPVVVAVTLCAEQVRDPSVTLWGSAGSATVHYTRDEVEWRTAAGTTTERHARTDLLEDLLARRDDGGELLVPLEGTAGFMQVLEAVRTAPDPLPVDPAAVDVVAEGDTERRVVRGVDALVEAAARQLRLFSELGAPWVPVEGARRSPA